MPRADFDEHAYIDRTELEKKLERAMEGTQHVIVYGESGTGKTWLYQKVIRNNGWHMQILNLASAAYFESMNMAFQDRAEVVEVEYKEQKGVSVGIPGTQGTLFHEGMFSVRRDEVLELVKRIRGQAGSRRAFLVLDNLEMVLQTKPLVEQLQSLVVMLDEPQYKEQDIKLMLVGVPSEIHRLYGNMQGVSSVGNRLKEIAVSGFDYPQANRLVRRLFDDLKYSVQGITEMKVQTDALFLTERIPQHLHELCLEMAYVAEDGGYILTREGYERARDSWVEGSLKEAHAALLANLNSRETKVGRRNQVLYSIARGQHRSFSTSDVEKMVRTDFPISTEGVTLGISQMLQELSEGDLPVIRRAPREGEYRFVKPTYRLLARAILTKNESGKVIVRKLNVDYT